MPAGSPEARAAFREGALLDAAREATGLYDFGDESFREPLRVLLRSLREEAPLSPAGVRAFLDRIQESLVTRLRVEDWIRRHPEILEEEIGDPLVVVGLTRTGSTRMQRLLASDPRHHAALWWELRRPAPLAEPRPGEPDPRIPLAVAEVEAILEADPGQAAIHPWDARAPDEEILLLEHSFLSHVPEAFAHLPSYRAWLDEQDWTPAYRYLERLLRFLQWQKRGRGELRERWVLKSPGHLGYLETLFRVFPGARVVHTHRDPLESIPSAASMNRSLWRAHCDRVDDREVGRQWKERMAWALARYLEARRGIPEERFADVWYRDALQDPLGEVEAAYRRFGLDLPPEARSAMERWLASNPREDRPPHEYTLEEFGFTREELEADFSAYRERFVLPHL